MKKLLIALALVTAPCAALAQGSGAMCASRPGFLGCLPAVTTLVRTNVVPVSQVDVARDATVAQILGLIQSSDLGTAFASPTFTGTPISTTAAPGTNTTQIATTAFTAAGLALKANLAGGAAFTGTVTMGTPLAVASGGTGAATAGAALTALGAAPTASPSFTGTVTMGTPLPVASGGTGSATAGAALTALGAAPIASPAFTGTFSTSVGSALTAAGTTQGTALALAAQVNEVTTAAASTGVLLPSAAIGTMITVFNRGANAVLVYPPSGGTIESGGTNVGVSLAAAATGRYTKVTSTQWRLG